MNDDCLGFIVGVIAGVLLCFILGYHSLKSTHDKEIISNACEWIYENESLETYVEYCK